MAYVVRITNVPPRIDAARLHFGRCSGPHCAEAPTALVFHLVEREGGQEFLSRRLSPAGAIGRRYRSRPCPPSTFGMSGICLSQHPRGFPGSFPSWKWEPTL